MSPTSASICPTTPSQHPEPADVETIKSKQISRIVNAPRPHPTTQPCPTEKRENTKCVSNDRGGQCDQNAYFFVKIGAILEVRRPFKVLANIRALRMLSPLARLNIRPLSNSLMGLLVGVSCANALASGTAHTDDESRSKMQRPEMENILQPN